MFNKRYYIIRIFTVKTLFFMDYNFSMRFYMPFCNLKLRHFSVLMIMENRSVILGGALIAAAVFAV